VNVLDGDIRRVLLAQLSDMHSDDPETLVVQEMGLCAHKARVDVAVINGALSGFEIKSASDTLARLAGQEAIYTGVLDFVTLVAAPRHLMLAARFLPTAWGLVRANERDGRVELAEERAPSRHTDVDPALLARMLWRDELADELRIRRMWTGLSSKPLIDLWERAAEIPVEELRATVRRRVKQRGDWRSQPRGPYARSNV
jgi:hypothetical protein